MSSQTSTHKALIGKWALKKWFIVHASSVFNYMEIAEVPADEPEKLLNRTIEITLFDITKDLSHLPIKLKFQIHKVDGDHAYTMFKMLELTRDYIKSLVRRGSSKVVSIVDVETKDKAKLRVQVLVITTYRCNTSQKKVIRAIAKEKVLQYGSNETLDEFLKDIFSTKLPNDIFIAAKKIYPLRKVEIMKIKVLKPPEVIPLPRKEVEVKEIEKEVESKTS